MVGVGLRAMMRMGLAMINIDLTDRERARIRLGLSYLKHAEGVDGKCFDHPDFAMDLNICAKLRPKKDSVEFEVDGANIMITSKNVYFLNPRAAYTRADFDALIAAYKAHKDEVK